jgi:hypothetical protein
MSRSFASLGDGSFQSHDDPLSDSKKELESGSDHSSLSGRRLCMLTARGASVGAVLKKGHSFSMSINEMLEDFTENGDGDDDDDDDDEVEVDV